MKRLKQVDLRFGIGGCEAKGYIPGSALINYLLCYELVNHIKIENEFFSKINVYVNDNPYPYSGWLEDGITNIAIAGNHDELMRMDNREALGEMSRLSLVGIKETLTWHGIACESLDHLDDKVMKQLDEFEFQIKGKVCKNAFNKQTAKLFVVPSGDVRYLNVVLRIYQARKVMAEIVVCKIAPTPEGFMSGIFSVAWPEKDLVVISVNWQHRFHNSFYGTKIFTCADLDGVTMVNTTYLERHIHVKLPKGCC
jgi:hypothetical protein